MILRNSISITIRDGEHCSLPTSALLFRIPEYAVRDCAADRWFPLRTSWLVKTQSSLGVSFELFDLPVGLEQAIAHRIPHIQRLGR